MAKNKNDSSSGTIALNKKARHDYHIHDKFEAGMELAGWEVKSCRAGKAQITDAYIIVKDGQVWLLGARIVPLQTASTHVVAEPERTRRLLLHKKEIGKLFGEMAQAGYTCVPLALYWKGNRIKLEIALVKGKKEYDKRDTERDRDWARQKERIVRAHNR